MTTKAWWILSVALVACNNAPADDATDDTEVDTEETEDTEVDDGFTGDAATILALDGDATVGETLYADNCELCHLADGMGGGPYPDIRPEDEEAIIQTVLEGPGVMTSAEDLQFSDQDVADVAAYAASL